MDVPQSEAASLKIFQDAMIEVFSELADLFGNPRSHGQVYGLLFSSPEPMTMEEISQKLEISMGSASMGLRALEEFGAVERNVTLESRSQATFRARLELRLLIEGFIQRRLMPRLDASNRKLETIGEVILTLPQTLAQEAQSKLDRVKNWHTRATTWIPLMEKLIVAGGKWNNGTLAPKGRKGK